MSILSALGASDGSTYIVYWKPVGPPTNIELRVQRLDASGVPVYGTDGMLVSSAMNMSTSTAIGSAVLDGEDNLYIGITATGDEQGHVFKLDPDGNHLWDSGGVTFAGGYGIVILPLSSGEAVVSWLNIPNALMQKYDALGQPVWPSPQPIESGTSKTAPGEMFELSNGDVEAIFHTYSFGISSTLWAQRFEGVSGAPVWSSPVQLSNKTTVWNTRYSVGQIDDAVYIGYKAASGLRFDSFLQRINPDGAIPWGINGSDFDLNETDYEMDTRIAIGTGAVWSLCNYKDPSQAENGERIQKFDSETGARLFTDYAKEVYPIGSDNVHASGLFLRNEAPFFLMESGWDNGASVTSLHLVALDAEGDFLWPEETQPMALFEASKSNTHLTRLVGNQTVGVWMEDKSSGPAVYAQNYEFEGGNSSVTSPALPSEFRFLPNPVADVLTCAFEAQQAMNVEWRVYNSLGRLVDAQRLGVGSGSQTMRWTVSDWPAGVYHVHGVLDSEVHLRSQTIVVQH